MGEVSIVLTSLPLPQGIINLFNLSLSALRQLAKDAEVHVPAGATKVAVIEALEAAVPLDVLEEQAADLLYAGNTSVTWLKLQNGGGFESEEFRDVVADLLGADPFEDEVRPTSVTAAPALVEGRELPDGKIVLTFVVRKKVQTVVHNFELKQVYADHFFQTIVRPDDAIFEVRTNHERARTLERTWLLEIAERMGRTVAYEPITLDQFAALRTELGAVLDAYKGKDASGSIYDTKEFSKSPSCADLADEPQFQEDTRDLEPVGADILFAVPDVGEIRLKVSLKGSIWFRTVVSEDIIDLVYDALKRVGAL